MGSKERSEYESNYVTTATKLFLYSDPLFVTKSTLLNFQCEKLLIPTHPSTRPHMCDLVADRPYNFLR